MRETGQAEKWGRAAPPPPATCPALPLPPSQASWPQPGRPPSGGPGLGPGSVGPFTGTFHPAASQQGLPVPPSKQHETRASRMCLSS